MISLEQVKQLDTRVREVVVAVKTLSAENSDLKLRVGELEAHLDAMRQEQTAKMAEEEQLEAQFQSVLDTLEDVDNETSDENPEPSAKNNITETETPEEVQDPELTTIPQTPEPPDEETAENESGPEGTPSPLLDPDAELAESENNSPETINLDSDTDEDGFQSEFDIF